jgi:hypothetical protein
MQARFFLPRRCRNRHPFVMITAVHRRKLIRTFRDTRSELILVTHKYLYALDLFTYLAHDGEFEIQNTDTVRLNVRP